MITPMSAPEPKALQNRSIPLDVRCRLSVLVGIEDDWFHRSGRPPTADELAATLRRWEADARTSGLDRDLQEPRW